MKKALLSLFGLATALAAMGVAAFLVLNYWERILSYATAGVRVATNILKNFSGDNIDKGDPADYFDSYEDCDI